jgi:hypothetical protein
MARISSWSKPRSRSLMAEREAQWGVRLAEDTTWLIRFFCLAVSFELVRSEAR